MDLHIIGSGSFGTALANAFSNSRRIKNVFLLSIEPDVIKEINSNNRNSKYLSDVKLNKKIIAHNNYSKLKSPGMVIIAVPSKFMMDVCSKIKPFIKDQIIISASKGLYNGKKTMTSLISANLTENVVSLSGPSIASELAKGLPCKLIVAGRNDLTKKTINMLKTKNVVLTPTTDIEGVQLLGFYKNIIAILVGICNGLETGNNFTASIISKAYTEFYYKNIKRIRRHTFVDAGGVGDLFVTSFSSFSRNQLFGTLLGKGHSVKIAEKMITQTIEGLENMRQVFRYRNKDILDLNLYSLFREILSKKHNPHNLKKMLIDYLSSNQIKAVLFDWGGVLTKGVFIKRIAMTLACKYDLDEDELFTLIDSEEANLLMNKESFKDFFKRINKFDFSFDIFKKIYLDSVTENKELILFLKKLKKTKRLFILSNNYSFISPILRKKYKNVFEDMFFSDDLGLIKPDINIFRHAIREIGLPPSQCLFVDDTLKNIKTAEEKGFNTIHFRSFSQFRKEIAKYI
ncbi:MAG: HAD-IA family hydrolase [Candidatus Woesearchaeota archaeon]